MSKILIFSDIHIFPHKKKYDRLQHCIDALDWVFKTAADREIKNIVFCGDLFHDRQKIDVPTYPNTFEVFQKYMKDTTRPNVYLLLGNHDLWHYEKCDISSVFPLSAVEGVQVVDRPCSLSIDGFPIGFLPYTHDPEKDLKKIKFTSKNKVLFGHVAIDGAIWNVAANTKAEVSIEHDGDMTKVTADIFKGYDQVFLGHYHAEQKLNDTVEYVGSPLQLSFGEAFQKKHIIVYDLATKDKEYIRNTFSPEHYPIHSKDIQTVKLENNFIRVMVDDIGSTDTIELKHDLSKKPLGSLEIKQTPRKDDPNLVSNATAILTKDNGIDVLQGFIDSRIDLKGLDKEKLLAIGKSIFEEVADD